MAIMTFDPNVITPPNLTVSAWNENRIFWDTRISLLSLHEQLFIDMSAENAQV